MYKYNAIKVDADHEHKFVKQYQYNLGKLQENYNRGIYTQEQFRELQQYFFENSYKEFFLQEVELETDLIEIV